MTHPVCRWTWTNSPRPRCWQQGPEEEARAADAAATADSGAVIHRPLRWINPEVAPRTVDQPAQEAHCRRMDPVGSSPQLMTNTTQPSLAEVVASGEETETDDEEDRQDQTVITTDPFTRQDLVDQQKPDDSLMTA